MTDYTQVRMRVTWVLLTLTTVLISTNYAEELSIPPSPTFSAARALTVENLPLDADGQSATQEFKVGDATLVIRRRSKTPVKFPSLPEPVYITSSPLAVNGEDSSKIISDQTGRQGRKMEMDSDGIPIIHGIRTPDDENDKKFTWRNARVIKNILVPYAAREVRPIPLYDAARQGRDVVIRPTAERAPVTQYAHPELGAQAALTAPETIPTAVVYFARDNPQDIHNDHSPYSFEPADLLHQREAPLLNDKRYELKLKPVKKAPSQDEFYYKPKRAHLYQPSQIQQQFANWNKEHRNYKYLQPAEYDTYYMPEDSRPLWERLTELIRANVQNSMDKVSEMTRPVVEPIVSASQTLAQNLGIGGGSRGAQEKVGVVGPILGTASVLPAIGLVASGAALGLGVAAVGRYLEQTQVVESKSRNRRSLVTGGRPIVSIQDNVAFDNMVHTLEASEENFLSKLQSYGHNSWSDNTPCAKRIFCDVMTQQSDDNILLMEKKMGTFLSLINPSVARALSDHMGEVMDAVRRRDCQSFICPSNRRSSSVSADAIALPAGGPAPR